MSFWAAFPFLRYVLWLLGGIIAGKIINSGNSDLWWILTALLAVSFVATGLFRYDKRNDTKLIAVEQGVLACALLFCFGFAGVTEQKEALFPEHLPKETTYWIIKTETDAVRTPKTLKVQARLLAYKNGDGWTETRGRIILYIRQQEEHDLPVAGSKLVVWAKINPVPPPLNPGVFNYKRYLEGKGICCQAFIASGDYHAAGFTSGNLIRKFALDIRNRALQQVEKYVKGNQEAAIVSSLLLGYRELLDDELVQAYSTAGTMHVLAVSGLHVGFIYLLLKFLFRSWRRNPRLKWLSFLCTLLVLWSYALVTGLSPSVMRAAGMFCLIDAALLLKRKTSIYNTLAIAAFVMLVLDPAMLWAVGFQLSFLAVAGIVYLHPRIASWYRGENKLIRKIWDLLSVSLAAQFATFPLALYYFGQFPTYFFITNLLIVPVVFFILAAGFAMLFVSMFSSTLAAWAGFVLFWMVKGVNLVVFTAEKLPWSRLSIHITGLETAFLIAGLIFLLIFFRTSKVSFAGSVFIFFGALLASLWLRSWQKHEQKKLLVYHIPGYSLLHISEGKEAFFMGGEMMPASQIHYQVNPNRSTKAGAAVGNDTILTNDFLPALNRFPAFSVLVWRGIKLVKVAERLPLPCPQKMPLQADYILLTHNATEDLETLACYFRGGTILIDGSNKAFIQKKLVKQAESLNLPFYLTSEKGAFELNL